MISSFWLVHKHQQHQATALTQQYDQQYDQCIQDWNDGVNDYRMFILGWTELFNYFYDEKLDADN